MAHDVKINEVALIGLRGHHTDLQSGSGSEAMARMARAVAVGIPHLSAQYPAGEPAARQRK